MLDVNLCIHRDLLGTDCHLLRTCNGSYRWVESLPEDAWCYGGIQITRDANSWLHSHGLSVDVLPPDRFVQSLKEVCIDDLPDYIPWGIILPRKEAIRYAQKILELLVVAFSSITDNSYESTFLITQRAILGMEQACVDGLTWRKFVNTQISGQTTIVNTFAPARSGLTTKVKYERNNSTGRLKVESGPQILTLQKNYREMLKSRYPDGDLLLLDYVSLEPRVILSVLKKKAVLDPHGYVQEKVLGNILDRKRTKIAVMGVLFGMGPKRLQLYLPDSVSAQDIIDLIRKHFGIRKLEKKLLTQFRKQNYITNHFGRVLKPSRTDAAGLVSYFTQSTGADVALMGFAQMIDLIKQEQWNIHPIFMIHDAIILDVHPAYTQYISKLMLAGEQIPGLKINKFSLGQDKIC